MADKKKHKSTGGKKIETLSNRVAPLTVSAVSTALSQASVSQATLMQDQLRGSGGPGPVVPTPGEGGGTGGTGAGGIVQIPSKITDFRAPAISGSTKIQLLEPQHESLSIRPLPPCDIDPSVKEHLLKEKVRDELISTRVETVAVAEEKLKLTMADTAVGELTDDRPLQIEDSAKVIKGELTGAGSTKVGLLSKTFGKLTTK